MLSKTKQQSTARSHASPEKRSGLKRSMREGSNNWGVCQRLNK